MDQNVVRGILIAVEGIDGSGKSTLAKNLAHTLTRESFSVLLTKEAGRNRSRIAIARHITCKRGRHCTKS